ncbi:hypothetical protein EON67_06770 [archaeon]|nr:MAG: hypothetical protein EON67_06770 [archaeon]
MPCAPPLRGCWRAEYERRESEVRFQMQELTKGVSYYKRLGLTFQTIEHDRVRLVFTLIDPTAVDKPFFFDIRLASNEAFEVLEVQPPVSGLSALVAELNETNNFSRFVQLMRQKFVETAAAAPAGGAAAAGGRR